MPDQQYDRAHERREQDREDRITKAVDKVGDDVHEVDGRLRQVELCVEGMKVQLANALKQLQDMKRNFNAVAIAIIIAIIATVLKATGVIK